ncbi:MAG: hypothetical protein ACOYVF_11140 [Candidatus Zixiibacteriota bacterium]
MKHIVFIILNVLLTAVLSAGTVKKQVSFYGVVQTDNSRDQVVAAQPMAGETVKWQVISSGGPVGNSTSYNLHGTVGQTAVGGGSSTTYNLDHGYWQVFESVEGCCVGVRGDVNCSDGDPDISDITRLIDFLYISHAPLAYCP